MGIFILERERKNKMRIRKGERAAVSGGIILLSLALKELNVYLNIWNISKALLIASAFIAGYPIALNAVRALRYKIIGIDALVTLAVIGAMFIGEYFEAAAVTFLFMFGNYLESITLEKTRSAIKSLLDLAPATGRVLREGKEIELSADEVIKGDMVIVKPGEKIPVDGTIIEGKAYVNQAAITVEAMPVNKEIEDKVFSGTVIESGYLKVRADKVGEDTTFSRILEMVEEAQDKKAKTQKFLDTFSKYYTPAIMVLTMVVYILTRDIELALTLLVIACPGALVISTPVSIVAGIGNGARKGILIKGGDIIEKLGTVKAVASDINTPEESEIITGQGIKARVGGRNILVGNRKLMESNDIKVSKDIKEYVKDEETDGQTVVLVSDSEKIIGVISIADTIRKGVPQLIKNLKAQGVKKVIMLT